MSENKAKRKMSDEAVSTVIDYLVTHPDFFNQHPHVLAEMNLLHESGPATSLIERQVSVLRRQNHKLRAELHDATENARLNEQLSDKIHQLSLRLLAAGDLFSSLTEASHCLSQDFDINAVSIHLWHDRIGAIPDELPDTVQVSSSDHQAVAKHLEKLQRGEVICGQLNADQIKQFFGDQQHIASAALLPLFYDKTFGVIGLGCQREERFRRDLGTVFVTRLAELISHKLWLELNRD